MKKTAFLFFFLLALSHAFPLACTQTSSRTMAVPALRDDGVGSLVNISVVVLPGSGGIFSSTSPVVGPATQKSQRTAAEYAAGWSGFNASTCDFMFSIESPDVINVDGPSAGAAMALLVSSALQNLSIRGGFTATGTIDENGGIGQVGGLVEKAHAAESAGLSVIALPVLEPSDKIVFHMIQNYSNATFVEVSGFDRRGPDFQFHKPAAAQHEELSPPARRKEMEIRRGFRRNRGRGNIRRIRKNFPRQFVSFLPIS
ncbi:MAG: hypothetical protein NT157_04225 [Candidatus Micrarchaeota archaeon]|nr:hypothetical protein [Candidatus Micrarchaeota archaeon]